MALWILAAAVAVSIVVSVLLRPKIKTPKPEATKDLESPTADAGRPIPVPFGSIMVKGINCLFSGDKSHKTFKVSA